MSDNTEAGPGHNSVEQKQEWVVRYVKCDEESQILNDERAAIRAEVKEAGEDPKAFVNEVNRSKQALKKRAGFDESCQAFREVIGDMDPEELWKHVFDRADKKNKAREEKKKKKEAAKAKKAVANSEDDAEEQRDAA